MAKRLGQTITCEVCPHHLFFDQKDLESRLGNKKGQVRPCLSTEEDREYLLENLEFIDTIGSDHAPHTIEEKMSDKAPPGFPGLETMLPLMLTLVHRGYLTIEDLKKKMHENPKRIFNLPDQPETYVEVNLDEEWTIPEKMQFSKAKWTPFAGMKVTGKVKRVVLRGQPVYVDGKFLAKEGQGKDLRKICAPRRPTTSRERVRISSGLREGQKTPIRPLSPTMGPSQQEQLKLESTLKGKHVLKAHMFTKDILYDLFHNANVLKRAINNRNKEQYCNLLKGKVMASVFHEPSTRTMLSFNTAMKRLGGEVEPINEVTSSAKKGESLEDTIKYISSVVDLVVLRHPGKGDVEKAALKSSKPVINAGDGIGEHPTQALLDIFTIRDEIGTVNHLKITMVGDLKHGRTVHSLARMLSLYDGIQFRFVSPPSLRIPDEVKQEIVNKGLTYQEFDLTELDSAIPDTDVLYVTRIQRERFEDDVSYQKACENYVINATTLNKAKTDMKILHPLPRNREIDPEVDSDDRATYFTQAENGTYVRMALLLATIL